jgi:hypothetical protein
VQIPNAAQAVIAPEKLRDYLLNPDHRRNRGKARFFVALGYSVVNWRVLAADLRSQHLTRDAAIGRRTFDGQTYVITARLQGPSGSATILSVWQIDDGTEVPRLITAYPA